MRWGWRAGALPRHPFFRGCDGIGRHGRFKICWPYGLVGSIPTVPTIEFWRDDRVDEGARLERECAATYRGFESHSLRHLDVPFV